MKGHSGALCTSHPPSSILLNWSTLSIHADSFLSEGPATLMGSKGFLGWSRVFHMAVLSLDKPGLQGARDNLGVQGSGGSPSDREVSQDLDNWIVFLGYAG